MQGGLAIIYVLHVQHTYSGGEGILKLFAQTFEWNIILKAHVHDFAARRETQWKGGSDVHLRLRTESLRVGEGKRGTAGGPLPELMQVKMTGVAQSPLLGEGDADGALLRISMIRSVHYQP